MPSEQDTIFNKKDTDLCDRDDFARDVWCLLGIPVDVMGPAWWEFQAQDRDLLGIPPDEGGLVRAAATIKNAIKNRERVSFVTPNVNWLVTALGDADMRRMIVDADLSLIDGAPLVMMAKWLGLPVDERVAGSDLFDMLRDTPDEGEPMRIFFFGGRDEAAREAHEKLNEKLNDEFGSKASPSMISAGWCNPGFGDVATMSTPEILEEVNAANPDFLIVALGAAKGQAWIDHNLQNLKMPAIAHLGAVVDFTAGTVKRCPPWMAKAGLEWMWRILADNALWKRYAKDALSLGNIMARSLMPQLVSKPKPGMVATDARLQEGDDVTRIHLTGSFTSGAALDPVRAAFRKAAQRRQDIVLDFSGCESIDLAFLGLVLMLEKHLTRAGKAVALRNITPKALKLFRLNKMNYNVLS